MISLRSVLTPSNLTSVRALETFADIPDSSVRRQTARAPIMRHHQRIGGLGGRIGIPMDDLRPMDKGFVRPYSGGLIQLLDFTDGPQGFHMFRAEVRFVGFRCHKQSENGLSDDGDEPYFIVSIEWTNTKENRTKVFGPFDHVKTGENTLIGALVSTTAQPPVSIHVLAMENDDGKPAEASAKVEKTLNAASAKLTLSLAILGANPAIGGMVQAFVNIFGGTVGDAAAAVFGMGDDTIGQSFKTLFEFDSNKLEWRNPKQLQAPDFDAPFNLELVLTDGEGGRYSAFFQVNLFTGPVIPCATRSVRCS